LLQYQLLLIAARGITLMSRFPAGDPSAEIRDHCDLDAAGQSLIKAAMRQLNLSARAYHRILKLSRTIAGLAGSERIEAAHLAEAVQYRPRQML
jgi:magnesium chelatase family protein